MKILKFPKTSIKFNLRTIKTKNIKETIKRIKQRKIVITRKEKTIKQTKKLK